MWPKVVPGLARRQRLRRYGEMGRLLFKYGRIDLGSIDGDTGREPTTRPRDEPTEGGELASELAADLEQLGPTFVKLGQLLSTRADLLPVPYLEALARLQDDVAPFPFDEVEPIVTGELGVRLSKAFSFFEPEPIAAASLGQVHRAALRDGRQVAVKVQRPHIQKQIVEDLEALLELAGVLERHTQLGRRVALHSLVEQFRRSLMRELDYRQEARNLDVLADNLAGFDRIVVPRPVDDYTTARVLTSDYIRGDKVTTLTPLERIETDGSALADDLFQAYLQQILVDGFVHADPHPGNVVLTRDGRIALLDLGMVTRIAPRLQERLLQLLLAVSEGRADEAATVAIRIGEPLSGFDEAMFRREVADLVSRTRDASLEELQVGQIVLRLTKLSVDGGIRVPPELALLGKTLLNLDQVGHVLDPEFDPNAALRRHSSRLLGARMRRELSPGGHRRCWPADNVRGSPWPLLPARRTAGRTLPPSGLANW